MQALVVCKILPQGPLTISTHDKCNCEMSRRRFMATTAAAAAGAAAGRMVMAGPFEPNEYLRIIAADKKLSAAWVRSLSVRGRKKTYSNPTARSHIGMPVGGLFAGTVYINGDGQLWLWDIFNRDQEGILPRHVEYKGNRVRMRDGANY